MIPISVAALETLGLGELVRAPSPIEITGLQIDSRLVRPGDLFVAIRGGRRVRRRRTRPRRDDARPERRVRGDGRDRRGASRRAARARFVGITGSTGKTSTKDILAALCAPVARTVATEGSYNAELGVPLTLGRLEPDTEICIVEMGMRGFGQITELCKIARPDIGVITAVGPVHLELVGSVDGVARSKAELVAALPEGGIAVVPTSADLEPHLRDDIDVRSVGPVDVELRDDGAHVAFGGGRDPVPAHSRHQAQNALTAMTAYEALGLPLDRLAESAAAVVLSPWRGEELPLPGGGFVVNDAYNANPTSMEAALRHLAERGAGRRLVAILGGMAELGEHTERHHRELAELAAELEIEVIAVGEVARALRLRARGRPTPTRRSRRRGSWSSPATPCSSRHPAPLPSKASPRPWRTRLTNGPSLHSGLDRHGRLRRDRAEVHRVPAPQRARPADPRGRPGRSRRQAGDTGDGGPADPALRAAALPGAVEVHAARADRALHDGRLRRDRLSGRLHQAPPPPLARAPGPVEAPPARGDHGRRGSRRPLADAARHLDLHPCRRTSTSRSRTPTTRSCSSSSPALRTVRT